MPSTEGLTDGKAAIPLYQQVIDIIKNDINSGTYKAGARIPNEFELAESYKVGRVTVRRAIEELVQQGYLTKQQGRGTFVKAPKLKRKIRQKDDVQSFSDACRVNEMEPGARIVSRKVLPADATEAQFFGVPAGSELICIERVRTADGIPVMLENNTYVYEDNAFLAKADLTDQSIFEVAGLLAPSRARLRSRVRHPKSPGCCPFPRESLCFIWRHISMTSSSGRLSSADSGL